MCQTVATTRQHEIPENPAPRGKHPSYAEVRKRLATVERVLKLRASIAPCGLSVYPFVRIFDERFVYICLWTGVGQGGVA